MGRPVDLDDADLPEPADEGRASSSSRATRRAPRRRARRPRPSRPRSDINNQGYQLLGEGKIDDAIAVFRKNAADHPASWNVWDSLAEGLENKGDKAGAVENYKKALSMAPEDQKKRLTDTLARLK